MKLNKNASFKDKSSINFEPLREQIKQLSGENKEDLLSKDLHCLNE